jgi:hypothetical protein
MIKWFAVMLLVLVSSSFDDIPKNNLGIGLVFYAPLNEGAGLKAIDKTRININNQLVIGSGGSWVRNKSFLFDGTNNAKIQMVKSTNLNLQTFPCTISLWCKRTGSGNRYLISDLNSAANLCGPLMFIAMTAGKFYIQWNSAALTLTSATSEISGQWMHIVGVRQGVTNSWTAKIFINGNLDATTTTILNPQPQSTAGSPAIATPGDYTGGSTFHYNGYIKNVMIWNRALTETEVRQLYVKQYIK